jgi:hypothetical protein
VLRPVAGHPLLAAATVDPKNAPLKSHNRVAFLDAISSKTCDIRPESVRYSATDQKTKPSPGKWKKILTKSRAPHNVF